MHPKLAAARVFLMERQPFLAAAAWKISIQEIPDADWPPAIGDIGMTSRGTCLVKAGLVQKATVKQLAACLVHEVMHLLYKHADRRADRDMTFWNLAGDMSINPEVLDVWPEDGFPYDVFMPDFVELERGLTADAYHEALLKMSEPGGTCCGSASGNRHPAEGLVVEGEEVPDALEWEATRVQVAQAVRAYRKNHGRGNIPGGLDRWADESLTPTPVDWKRALAGTVRSELKRSGCYDYTYKRPSHRKIPHIILPAMRMPHLKAAVISDTSGSRGKKEMMEDLADVKGILKACGADDIDFISVDAEVQGRGRVRNAAQAGRVLKGGGGTCMAPGLAAAVSSREKPDIIVVLTDGEVADWPEVGPRVRTVIVVPEGGPETPAWARRVERPDVDYGGAGEDDDE